MKKMLPYTLILIFPYVPVLAVPAYLGNLPFMPDFPFFLVLLGILYAAALLSAVLLLLRNLKTARSARELLGINMAVKLLHVPAYLLLFFFGFASLITIFTAGFAVVVMVLDGLAIGLSGLVGLGAVLRFRGEGGLPMHKAALHGFLQFV